MKQLNMIMDPVLLSRFEKTYCHFNDAIVYYEYGLEVALLRNRGGKAYFYYRDPNYSTWNLFKGPIQEYFPVHEQIQDLISKKSQYKLKPVRMSIRTGITNRYTIVQNDIHVIVQPGIASIFCRDNYPAVFNVKREQAIEIYSPDGKVICKVKPDLTGDDLFNLQLLGVNEKKISDFIAVADEINSHFKIPGWDEIRDSSQENLIII